jgi:hypothetical protein
MSYLDWLAEFVVATHFAELPATTVAVAKDPDGLTEGTGTQGSLLSRSAAPYPPVKRLAS